ncbi:MAG: hypothetical protein HQ536_00015 [Parcubacteria group bacterium]|nr:hypothetical protein [Parcubacteria group bacterium]
MTRADPKEAAIVTAFQSNASEIKVGAVIVERKGIIIIGTGNNSCGHAPTEALKTARSHLQKRLPFATLYVYAYHANLANDIYATPCADCTKILKEAGLAKIIYSTPSGEWEEVNLITKNENEEEVESVCR